MKITTKILLLTATAGATLLLLAQDGPPNSQGGPQSAPGPGTPGGGHRHMRPPPAIIDALDTNHDGVIDANEIANAVEALKKLDKNGDGQLTPDEFLGPPPDMPSGPGAKGPNHQGSPDGERAPQGPRGPHPGGSNGPENCPQRPPGE